MRYTSLGTAVAALALLATPALAQPQTSQAPVQAQAPVPAPAPAPAQSQGGQPQGQVSAQDRDFVTQAAAGGTLEIDLGKIAQDKARRQEVRQFGQRMVEDHQTANEDLQRIAGALGVQVPPDLPPDEQRKVERFRDMEDGEFDAAYVQAMVEDHRKTVALFQKQADEGQNQDLKTFAGDTLPILREHLEMARQLEQGGGAMAAAGAGGGVQRSAEELLGSAVYGSNGEQVGEVNDILVGADGQARRLVIDQGGFLGIGEKRIVLDMDQVEVAQDGIQVRMTDEQLSELPEYTGQ